ncbi:hypothetical protein [Nocardia brasiliensis]|uniref:hypothetical protein n=1 Tax=Nocardia brasiliensis TaxID=37326 RepID=UPI002456094D|nr:hypothetical protein [Nocardia brasiliensis]
MSSRTTTRPALTVAIRAVAALTVIGSAVAVTALTVRTDDDVTTVVVTQEQAAAAARHAAPVTPAPAAAAPAPAAPGPAAPPAAAPAAAVPLGSGGVPAAVSINPGAGAPDAGAALNSSVPLGTGNAPNGSGPLGAADPFASAPVATQPPCPLGWPAPEQQGGLASLIGLAPLAGPFSSEAFALGSVYQPVLQLAGPVLAEIAPVIAQYQPVIDPIITQVQGVEAVVLQAILPYYGPYRGQLIAAEGELAKVLTPILNRVYNSEIASCLVAWQGQIIDQAKGGRITVASLAHPGTVVELGPES